MRRWMRAIPALLIAVPALPVGAQAFAENRALAEQIAAPIRESLLDQMSIWRPILFGDGASEDAVAARYRGRYDELEMQVRGQSHPGDLARSRYAFQELLDDALRGRHKQDRRAGLVEGGFKAFRGEMAARAESSAFARRATRQAARRVEAIASDEAFLARGAAPEPVEVFIVPTPAEPVAAVAPQPLESIPALRRFDIGPSPILPLSVAQRRGFPEALMRNPGPGVVSGAPPARRRAAGPPSPVDFQSIPFWLPESQRGRLRVEDFDEMRDHLVRRGARAEYVNLLIRESLERGINPAVPLAQVLQESSFDPKAKGKNGEFGLWQVRENMHRDENGRFYTRQQLLDPMINMVAGFRILLQKLATFGNDLRLALASYNAGEHAVRNKGAADRYRETRHYTRVVGRNALLLTSLIDYD